MWRGGESEIFQFLPPPPPLKGGVNLAQPSVGCSRDVIRDMVVVTWLKRCAHHFVAKAVIFLAFQSVSI